MDSHDPTIPVIDPTRTPLIVKTEKATDKSQVEELREKELLMQCIKTQTRLISKLFEFMRAHQAKDTWGRGNYFKDGSGRKTRIGRLLDETHELGVQLGELTSELIDENVFEKRDSRGRLLLRCNVCEKEAPFGRVIDTAHGMPGTYMSGSERLVCALCKEDTVYPGDERLPEFTSAFKHE